MRQLRRIVVVGRVQGVGFRLWTMRRAIDLGVDGWVRNLNDGGVEAVLAGEDDQLRVLIEECRRGPERALVTQVSEFATSEDPGIGFRVSR